MAFSPALFACSRSQPVRAGVQPRIHTPVGTIRLNAFIEDVNVSEGEPQGVFELQQGGYILAWQGSAFQAELLLCRPSITLVEAMRVDDCWAGLWRVAALRYLASCTFVAEWDGSQRPLDGGSATGQGLDAQTWDDGILAISLGTQDGERLFERALRGDGLPTSGAARLGTSEADRLALVEHRHMGFRIPLPSLEKGELCQIHFVAAWSQFSADDDSTWFAVNCTPNQILDGGGCT